MGFIADSVLGQIVATTGTIVAAILTLVANQTWRRARRRAGKPMSHTSTRLLWSVAVVGCILLVGGIIWVPDLKDRMAYAAVVVLAGFTMALLFAGVKFSEWTRETKQEQHAINRQTRATQNLIAFVAKHSHIPPEVLAQEFEDADNEGAA